MSVWWLRMKNKQVVGMCLCTHNDEATIERAINSLLNNTRKPNVIVVGDNNSNDHTYKILCELLDADMVEKDGNIGWPSQFEGHLNGVKIIVFKSQTECSAKILNHCFKILPLDTTAVGFLYCRDWYEPKKIAKSLSIFEQHKCVACVVTDHNQYITETNYARRFNKSFSYDRLLRGCIYDRNFLVRVESMQILRRGFDESLPDKEEYELLLRISEVGLIYHIPEALHNCSHKTVLPLSKYEDHIRKMTIQRRLQNA